MAESAYPIRGFSSFMYHEFRSLENTSHLFKIFADKYQAIDNFDHGFEGVIKEEALFGDSKLYMDYQVKLNYLNE